MRYKILARVTFWLHAILSAWLFAGGLVATFCHWYAPIHAEILLVVLITQWANEWKCLLTNFEKSMLVKGGQEPYEGAFLRHYAQLFLGLTIPPGWIVRALLTVLLWSLAIWAIHI